MRRSVELPLETIEQHGQKMHLAKVRCSFFVSKAAIVNDQLVFDASSGYTVIINMRMVVTTLL